MHPHWSPAGRAGPTLLLGQASVSDAWGSGRPPFSRRAPGNATPWRKDVRMKHKTEVPEKKTLVLDKKADLAGPGIGNYAELEKILPSTTLPAQSEGNAAGDHRGQAIHRGQPLQRAEPHDGRGPSDRRRRERCQRHLDRDGSRTPISSTSPTTATSIRSTRRLFRRPRSGREWPCASSDCKPGEGINTDMRAVRKDYFLDHDHSAYVDQWDWERVMTPEERNLTFLTKIVTNIWKVITGAEKYAQEAPRAERSAVPESPRSAHVPAGGRDPGNLPRPAAQAA